MSSITAEIAVQDNNSASTFGIPTTPKTTPFMTPTPLSPSHLSPHGSVINLNSQKEDAQVSFYFCFFVHLLSCL